MSRRSVRDHQRVPEPAVELPDPTRPPRPAPGCDVCQALDQQRAAADEAGDIRLATMYEVEIRRHPTHRTGA